MTTPVVELAPGAHDNGLASMLAELVVANLLDNPAKAHDFTRLGGRVAIIAEDAGVSLTLHFQHGKLVVHDGIAGLPDVTIVAPSDEVMKLSLVELREVRLGRDRTLALPDPRGENARAIQKAVLERRVRIHGLLSNLPLLLRLTRVMSVS